MRPLNLIDKAFLLKKTRLFGSLDLDLLLTISDKMEILLFKKGAKIVNFDQEAHRMYLIVEGKVVIFDRHQKLLAELGSSEFFGDEAMFHEKPYAYQAMCLSDVTLLALSRSHLLSIIMECPTVAISLLETYTANITFRKRG
jgi:CRP/FNR family cyclic AMP-dependent transcriptional regulator